MKSNHHQARSYNQSLRNYFQALQTREAAGKLPQEFNPKMEQFIQELKRLIAHSRSTELARAA